MRPWLRFASGEAVVAEHSRTSPHIREHSRTSATAWNWVCFRQSQSQLARVVETIRQNRTFPDILGHRLHKIYATPRQGSRNAGGAWALRGALRYWVFKERPSTHS